MINEKMEKAFLDQINKELYSEYASNWNFENQWTWTGIINGQNKQVKCPRLAWE